MPPVKRSDMNAEGQAIYDKVAGANRTTPMLGPGGVSLHMPKVAQAMDILNQYLRYDSVIGRRYIEVAILVAARATEYQWSRCMSLPDCASRVQLSAWLVLG